MSELMLAQDEKIIWADYKRILVFRDPFTKYTLTNRALYIESGVLRYSFSEIRLFRICDLSISKTILERMCGTGSLNVISTDKSTPSLRIGAILDVGKLKMLLNEHVDSERKRQGIRMGEFIR